MPAFSDPEGMLIVGTVRQGCLSAICFERRDQRPDDVIIQILYCGVCHSDLHTVRNDWASWFPTTYGLGGLGHMALKLANALGADVTLFTRSAGKEKDARRLGAHNVVLSTDKGQMASVQGRFDLIIDTVPYVHDLNHYLPTLTINGTLVLLGYVEDSWSRC